MTEGAAGPTSAVDPDLDPERDGGGAGSGSLGELYRREHLRMVRLAHLLVGSNAEAEELVHDAFARLHQRWGTVREPVAYLRVAVVNACRSHLRRRVRERDRQPAPAGPSLPPEIDETWAALARLSPRRRAALVLRFYEDMTAADVARALGCREATARSLIHRGLTQMRKEMEP